MKSEEEGDIYQDSLKFMKECCEYIHQFHPRELPRIIGNLELRLVAPTVNTPKQVVKYLVDELKEIQAKQDKGE